MFEELKEARELINEIILGVGTIQEKIGREFDLKKLRDQLLALPEQIKKTQVLVLTKKGELAELEQQIKQHEAEISFEINSEQGSNGKPKFSNENLRKAEWIKRLSKNEKYRGLRQSYSATEFKLWEFEAETDKLRRQFQAFLAHKDLIVAELNLYTK